jgi:hypothetical protein
LISPLSDGMKAHDALPSCPWEKPVSVRTVGASTPHEGFERRDGEHNHGGCGKATRKHCGHRSSSAPWLQPRSAGGGRTSSWPMPAFSSPKRPQAGRVLTDSQRALDEACDRAVARFLDEVDPNRLLDFGSEMIPSFREHVAD